MAVERWTAYKDMGKRLAAHRLTGLLSVALEGSESIGAIHTDRSTAFIWRGHSAGLRAALPPWTSSPMGPRISLGTTSLRTISSSSPSTCRT